MLQDLALHLACEIGIFFWTVEYHSLSFSPAVTSQHWSGLFIPVALFICMLGFPFGLGVVVLFHFEAK